MTITLPRRPAWASPDSTDLFADDAIVWFSEREGAHRLGIGRTDVRTGEAWQAAERCVWLDDDALTPDAARTLGSQLLALADLVESGD